MHRGGCLLSHRSGVWFGWQWPVWAPGKRGRNLKLGRWTKLGNHVSVPGIFVGGEYGNATNDTYYTYIRIYYRHIMLVSRKYQCFPNLLHHNRRPDLIWKNMSLSDGLDLFDYKCRSIWRVNCVSIIFCKPLSYMSVGNWCKIYWCFFWYEKNAVRQTVLRLDEDEVLLILDRCQLLDESGGLWRPAWPLMGANLLEMFFFFWKLPNKTVILSSF